MDGCHGGDPAASNRNPLKEREDTLGYAGLNLVQLSDSSTWDFKVCGLGFLCLASPPRNSAHSHVLIYSESRLVVDGSK